MLMLFCLQCAMPCDVTAEHCDVICSSTPHVSIMFIVYVQALDRRLYHGTLYNIYYTGFHAFMHVFLLSLSSCYQFHRLDSYERYC